jgi:hypothetical protein
MGNPGTYGGVGNANWSALGAGSFYGNSTAVGGGGNLARDQLDAARMGVAKIPSAQYPDGYLGNINSRRGDRLLDALKQNNRSYTRGVHVGERIDATDYFWPAEFNPERGLKNEARGIKTAPLLQLAPPPHLVNDGKSNPTNSIPGVQDPKRTQQLMRLRPPWS